MPTSAFSRKKYDRSFFLLLGLSLSLAAMLTAFRWASPNQISRLTVDKSDYQDELQFVDLTRNVEIEKEQVNRPKPNPLNISTTPEPDPVTDPTPKPTPEPITEPQPGTGTIILPIDSSPEPELPFRIVEDMPIYPGGESALFADVSKNFKIPEIDRRAGLEGTVHLSFIVNGQGEVVEVTILRGISPATDEAAIRAVQKLKRFTPGKQRGRAVSVIFTLPIRVSLR